MFFNLERSEGLKTLNLDRNQTRKIKIIAKNFLSKIIHTAVALDLKQHYLIPCSTDWMGLQKCGPDPDPDSGKYRIRILYPQKDPCNCNFFVI